MGNFDVSIITYDKNGNIQTLQRNTIDDLDYDYLGNQLTRVEDVTSNTQGFKNVSSTVGTREYSYDKNGNMVSDTNKGISEIVYNYLNLPQQVTLDNGNTIQYTYDAAGIKHRKTFDGKEWTYVGAFHYEKEASESVADLEFIQHSEGRVLKSGSNWNYQYNLTDHLGNVRVTVNEFGNVVQRDGYYPFGGTFNSSATSPENLYKYNGMEEQKEFESYLTDYRTYDPWLGRWGQIDPKVNEFESPYAGMSNNPLKFADPLGDTVIYFIDNEGAGGQGHMGMAFQDGNGSWYYASQGATEDGGVLGMLAGSNAAGGLEIVPLQVREQRAVVDENGDPVLDENGDPVTETVTRNATEAEVTGFVKSGQLGYQYDESVTYGTTPEQDAQISQNAFKLQRDYNRGSRSYNLYFNNCVDACQEITQGGTGIGLPADNDPRPNSYFDRLRSTNPAEIKKKNQEAIKRVNKLRIN